MSPIIEEKFTPFLTLATTGVNGWFMAFCPEFDVSACGIDHNAVVEDLFDIIKRNASVLLKKKEGISPQLIKWSEEIIKQEDISVLFKKQQ